MNGLDVQGQLAGTAIGKVVARNQCDEHVMQTHSRSRLGETERLVDAG